jgi:hypothetical protein
MLFPACRFPIWRSLADEILKTTHCVTKGEACEICHKQLFLTPLVGDDALQMKQGESLQASTVFVRLVALARRYNRLPI